MTMPSKTSEFSEVFDLDLDLENLLGEFHREDSEDTKDTEDSEDSEATEDSEDAPQMSNGELEYIVQVSKKNNEINSWTLAEEALLQQLTTAVARVKLNDAIEAWKKAEEAEEAHQKAEYESQMEIELFKSLMRTMETAERQLPDTRARTGRKYKAVFLRRKMDESYPSGPSWWSHIFIRRKFGPPYPRSDWCEAQVATFRAEAGENWIALSPDWLESKKEEAKAWLKADEDRKDAEFLNGLSIPPEDLAVPPAMDGHCSYVEFATARRLYGTTRPVLEPKSQVYQQKEEAKAWLKADEDRKDAEFLKGRHIPPEDISVPPATVTHQPYGDFVSSRQLYGAKCLILEAAHRRAEKAEARRLAEEDKTEVARRRVEVIASETIGWESHHMEEYYRRRQLAVDAFQRQFAEEEHCQNRFLAIRPLSQNEHDFLQERKRAYWIREEITLEQWKLFDMQLAAQWSQRYGNPHFALELNGRQRQCVRIIEDYQAQELATLRKIEEIAVRLQAEHEAELQRNSSQVAR